MRAREKSLELIECCRPLDAPTLSWEALLFEFVRWPWNLLGVTQAIVGHLARREFAFRVTP